jgi:hypothetical protein
MVKSAFDLYRWDLLKQLGYERMPKTLAEEEKMWDTISTQMISGYSPTKPPPEYGDTQDSAKDTAPATTSMGDGEAPLVDLRIATHKLLLIYRAPERGSKGDSS